MRVEIWTDIICPWCGIGEHRLQAAIAQFAHGDDVEVVHRSFQLDPTMPVGQAKPAREMLIQKGFAPAQIGEMTKRIELLAEADGLSPYHVTDNQVGNTSLAHELAAWATEQGRGDDAWAKLYRAYFGERRSVFDVDALVQIAGELGLDEAAARAVLVDRRYEAQVLSDGRAAAKPGAHGVPFVVVDEKYGVSGAQAVEVFVDALEQAWRDRPVKTGGDANLCGPDGCEI